MSLLSNSKVDNISTSDSILYTVPANKVGILIGGNIANKVDTVIRVDITIESGAKTYTFLKGLTIPPNAAFSFSGYEQKLVLGAGDKIKAKSSVNNSADSWLSISELEV